MAKVNFSKLGIKKEQDNTKTIEFNGQEIEVKQYLPAQEKLQFISNVINYSADDNRFPNPLKIKVFFSLEVLYNYTNINFTDKHREDAAKLFDMVNTSGLLLAVYDAINPSELELLSSTCNDTIQSIYHQMNSAYGIVQSIAQDFQDVDMNATKIREKLADPNVVPMLKEVMTKLG